MPVIASGGVGTTPYLAEQMLGVPAGSPRAPRFMPMDLYKSGDHFVLHADLPGVDRDLLALLNRRAALANEVGVIKRVEGSPVVFSGDTLFNGGPGATGRSYSDRPTIVQSITEKLLPLPDDTVVHTGHGDSTTIGAERGNVPAED